MVPLVLTHSQIAETRNTAQGLPLPPFLPRDVLGRLGHSRKEALLVDGAVIIAANALAPVPTWRNDPFGAF